VKAVNTDYPFKRLSLEEKEREMAASREARSGLFFLNDEESKHVVVQR
jgi:hypothetical protein